MVTRKEGKNAIMTSIMEKAGLDTKARAIVFSLPVTETAGMRLIEEDQEPVKRHADKEQERSAVETRRAAFCIPVSGMGEAF